MPVLPTPGGLIGGRSPRRPRPAAALIAIWIVAGSSPAARADRPAAGDEPAEPTTVISERVTVTDSRLRDRPPEKRRVPAHVSVVERHEVETAGAVTLQELLAGQPGVVAFDATGGAISTTLDLRGFTGGGLKVFLDGAPLNEPRNNSLSLELVPPALVERVEITRGSSAALAGGGSEAGVINLFTRAGDDPGGRFRVSAGEFETHEATLSGWTRNARADFFGSAGFFETGGFRHNADGELARLAAAAGWDAGPARLRLTVLDSASDLGNPGALRLDELAADRDAAPFNGLDYSDEHTRQATLNLAAAPAGNLSFTANLFARDRESEILTTGRAAPIFGGFFLDSTTELVGLTGQLTRFADGGELVAGVEWLDGDTDARGIPTPAASPGEIDAIPPSSDNTTGRRDIAAYLQHRWRPDERLTLTLGARWDEEEVGYRERLPDPTNRDARVYSELSLRGGLVWSWHPDWEGYAAYGEGFLPPTVEELFSFPLFGSNPGLEPEDSTSLELGLRRTAGRGRLQAALFRIDTRDEIVFDPDSPLGPFGANVNAGETRRQGLELAIGGRPRTALRVSASLTLTDAEFRSGANRGRSVPLVPDQRMGVGIEADLSTRLTLRADALWVGEQVLDNDDANLQAALEAYSVLDARLTWRPVGAGPEAKGISLFAAARNLLDEQYATRGIYAFDFSIFTNAVFLTPAPGRTLSAGVEWRF